MKNEVMAERYAQALLEVAQKEGQAEKVLEQINQFQKGAASLPQLRKFWENPRIPSEEKKNLIDRIFEAEKEGLLARFVDLLLRKGRIQYLEATFLSYQKVHDRQRGVMKGTLTVAFPLEKGVIDQLRSKLESQFDRKLELTYSENPKLIGGFIFSTGVLLIDGSVKRQLLELEEKMKSAPLS